jgi:hypothetical protein
MAQILTIAGMIVIVVLLTRHVNKNHPHKNLKTND